MNALFACPKCSQRLSLAGLPAGKSGRCPKCGNSITVPPSTADQSVSKGSASASAVAAPTATSSLPATIGAYQVRGKLGEGAFGVVYRAYDPQLGREVAIKMLKAAVVKSTKVLERFLREARVVGQMLHGNIVPVYQLGQLGEDYYIVSAFIPGRPLDAAIPENGMDQAQAVGLVLQLLEALAYAHERGVFHRDVKPANAMLDDKGTLYLMDFGLAGLHDQEGQRMTHDGAVMGTPAYMAPEQARGNTAQVGPAADQYSAGMVLYELLTGRLAFEAPSLVALMYQVMESTPPPPSQVRPGVNPMLEAICLKALGKAPADRFASCREFADTLKGWLSRRDPAQAAPGHDTFSLQGNRTSAQNIGTVGPRSTLNTSAARQTVLPAAPSTPPAAVSAAAAGRPAWRLWLALGAFAVPLILVAAYILLAGSGSHKKSIETQKDGLFRKSKQ